MNTQRNRPDEEIILFDFLSTNLIYIDMFEYWNQQAATILLEIHRLVRRSSDAIRSRMSDLISVIVSTHMLIGQMEDDSVLHDAFEYY